MEPTPGIIHDGHNLFKNTVNEYLQELPQPVQSRLYQSPATCLAIYRLLSPMAKFFIMSMIFQDEEVSLRDLDRWVKPDAKFQLHDAIKSMKLLHLITEGRSGQPLMVQLNSIFKESFKNALTGGEVKNSFGNVVEEENDPVTMAMLDSYAADKWETILHFMVGTPLTKSPGKNVLSLLRHSKLMEVDESSKELKITNEGFQFLLQDANAQIWTLLLQYLTMAETFQMDPVDVLNLIFMIGALELGKAYSVVGLSETQKTMLQDLRDYGLVFQKQSNLSKFYPTRLATMLTSDVVSIRSASGAVNSVLRQRAEGVDGKVLNGTALGDDDLQAGGEGALDGALIVETNFKLYSYSNSPLQIAILSLFIHLKTRFQNMVTGQITRESIRRALHNGITADQIIAYMETHAHPQMRRLAGDNLEKKLELDPNCRDTLQVLPPTVVDQIKLWQLELDRIISYDGYLFRDFDNLQEYQVLAQYARDIGVLLWSDDKKKMFFVSKEGNAQVIDFHKRKFRKK
ncbi:ADL274Wp [Eremothecium gossypii ATCC 10895]|uniref:General transcription and DNA repair factor IIH subunit TFB2 n=1 Tax=Eremothecium gossypii (strain ATCC 10895 / CBS 109.51 / FGSC 9923 / NRRL Y-1056) TaxID=284811 RepID=TFB2_EREGS|nr:ADL274Wp [Eremothecium gossypii ATCC 10895]Q75B51.1 RecName: Full=General transcription and DNA repair factor IIH subunit TFB2; Short=TFIIH subunit TFB2; AltName: Full=RNA polymerase II transcription factor B subunit 2 [Eremothecium gossypii ATCC 10895]AAS51646.1 ADL274Wp [Eremothecium gossypii ATCC 10895]AEY95942.1 FADL274Wp [Eremothecium gossypii FDAG1]